MADCSDALFEGLLPENVFMKKYLALRNKCEQLQQGNEKLVNRIQHVKKQVKRYKRDRRFLQSRLDSYNDNYKDAQVPVMWEEDQMYNLLKPPSQSPPTKDAIPSVVPPEIIPPSTKTKPSKKIKSLLKTQDQSQNKGSNQPIVDPLSNFKSLLAGQGIKSEPLEMLAEIKQEPVEVVTGQVHTSAFHMFCGQYKQAIQNQYLKEKNELITSHELTKRLAMKWQTLNQEEKKIYNDMYELEKRRVESEALQKHAAASALEAMQLESDAAVSSLLNT